MSNTSTVTPYDSVATTSPVTSSNHTGTDALAACFAGAVAVAQWLMEKTPEEEQRRRDYRKQRGKELARVTTVGLHLSSPESLLSSAEHLGYRLEPSARTSTSVSQRPLLLSNARTGERLAIARSDKGKLVLSAAGESQHLHQLMRQHTLDRAVHHFKSRGMAVETVQLTNGEVQIVAREQGRPHNDGMAAVKAKVGTDGRSIIDVDCISGNRCEHIVRDFAKAVGGEITTMTKKRSYYQQPGEATRPKVKV